MCSIPYRIYQCLVSDLLTGDEWGAADAISQQGALRRSKASLDHIKMHSILERIRDQGMALTGVCSWAQPAERKSRAGGRERERANCWPQPTTKPNFLQSIFLCRLLERRGEEGKGVLNVVRCNTPYGSSMIFVVLLWYSTLLLFSPFASRLGCVALFSLYSLIFFSAWLAVPRRPPPKRQACSGMV